MQTGSFKNSGMKRSNTVLWAYTYHRISGGNDALASEDKSKVCTQADENGIELENKRNFSADFLGKKKEKKRIFSNIKHSAPMHSDESALGTEKRW